MDIIEERKKAFWKRLEFLKEKKNMPYFLMLLIAGFGTYIRVQNLHLLKDSTTGKSIPLALDPFVFLRYVKYLLAHGSLMANDVMRYYPFGYSNMAEFTVLSHFIVYLYKIWHFFQPSITIEKVHVLYPPICFFIGIIFFFLFVKEMFDWKIGLLASSFLSVMPAYLYRTMAGFSDKEPFAMMMWFIALFFFTKSQKCDKTSKAGLFGVTAGLASGLATAEWGGTQFLYLFIGTYMIIRIIFNIIEKKDVLPYILWVVTTFAIAGFIYPSRYKLSNLLVSATVAPVSLSFLMAGVLFVMHSAKVKEKIAKFKPNLPEGITILLISIILSIITLTIMRGPSAVINVAKHIYIAYKKSALATYAGRWAVTVAESHQPYLLDIISQFRVRWFSSLYLLTFIAGSAILTYNLTIRLGRKTAQKMSIAFVTFILVFLISRYSPSSVLNGETKLSSLLYLGSFIAFFAGIIYFYIKSYYTNKELFNKIKGINKVGFLALSIFIFSAIGARTAIRLIFVFAPATAIMAGYCIAELYKIASSKLKQENYIRLGKAAVVIITIMILYSFSQTSLTQAKYTGPSYNIQWQKAMEWVRENTPENAVFAHWWDYGYWVQTGGNRTTLSDGGNAGGPGINYFIGRHVLTGESETEALEYLKARNATHLLMISDEIGKYGAYSSIGADENYDRYSWIPTFQMDEKRIQETRNATVFLYAGGTAVDHDFIYKDKLFPARKAAILGFFVPVHFEKKTEGNETYVIKQFQQPYAVAAYGSMQEKIPLGCIYADKKLIDFNVKEGEGLNGCIVIIPKVSGNRQNPMGAALYVSPTARKGMFAQLYLFNKRSDYFRLVYNDEDTMTNLVLYNGRIIGPLKIWEISYPANLSIPQEYYGTQLPNPELGVVKEEWQ